MRSRLHQPVVVALSALLLGACAGPERAPTPDIQATVEAPTPVSSPRTPEPNEVVSETHPTSYFDIEYKVCGSSAPDQDCILHSPGELPADEDGDTVYDYVAVLGEALDAAYEQYRAWGLSVPERRWTVTVKDLSGVAGETNRAPLLGYLRIDNDMAGFAGDPLDWVVFTAGHELLHLTQSFDEGGGGSILWLREGTANTLPDLVGGVSDGIDGYIQQTGEFPWGGRSLTELPEGNEYWSALFWRYVAEHAGGVDTLVRVINSIGDFGGFTDGISHLKEALELAPGSPTLVDVYVDFAIANYVLNSSHIEESSRSGFDPAVAHVSSEVYAGLPARWKYSDAENLSSIGADSRRFLRPAIVRSDDMGVAIDHEVQRWATQYHEFLLPDVEAVRITVEFDGAGSSAAGDEAFAVSVFASGPSVFTADRLQMDGQNTATFASDLRGHTKVAVIVSGADNGGSYHLLVSSGPTDEAQSLPSLATDLSKQLMDGTVTVLISTLVGTGSFDCNNEEVCGGFGGDGGPAIDALLSFPYDVSADDQGGLLVADAGNQRIRRVDLTSGVITTIADTIFLGEDSYPVSLAVKSNGDIFVADLSANRILFISAGSETARIIAGSGAAEHTGDGGPLLSAGMIPCGIDIDAQGRLVIVDWNYGLRIIDLKRDSIQTLVVADPSQGCPLEVGDDGLIYYTDKAMLISFNPITKQRMVLLGTCSYDCDEYANVDRAVSAGALPSAEELNGIVADESGNLFLSWAFGEHRINYLARGSDSLLALAGTGDSNFRDGVGEDAAFCLPAGMTLDQQGTLFVADSCNHRVRRVIFEPTLWTGSEGLAPSPRGGAGG